ncbi:hydroxyneurosporene synthase [Isosphaera pallida ATCC 43644]|uniref:Hydroxyneurosporene synthase n=1 Tax=Isosphaera pallida (strain ATCC 43644 / DSM 9630 / IS1B) TaxID=575540 RepID=E8QZL3_ISOPI|nr:hydroxyneurosporene synthase [Isosphaera pallida]ADV62149.1 hydroxyneurosporene synthase [Isosphaera pallida ATCC 43644]
MIPQPHHDVLTKPTHVATTPDPDRFFAFEQPGAHEWWYFDAISHDGRDALVIVFYAGLPFDPSFGVAAIRHHRDPSRFPKPDPLDHCAVGLCWYRDGQTAAYALNGFRRPDFSYRTDPFTVAIDANCLERDHEGVYHLSLDTPSKNGDARLKAKLHFTPAASTRPLERNLGAPDHPHHWILAAADCRVEGDLEIVPITHGRPRFRLPAQPDGPSGGPRKLSAAHLAFQGRGYHDHNAGAEEMSRAMTRWRWGRFHFEDRTLIYYQSEPRPGKGDPAALVIECRDGEPIQLDERPVLQLDDRSRTVFGLQHARRLTAPGHGLTWEQTHLVDQGPFYLRWLPIARRLDQDVSAPIIRGISELLDTHHLNRIWFNWMIPYRLKRPASSTPRS